MTQPTYTDYYIFIFYLIFIVWVCVLLLVDFFIPRGCKGIIVFFVALGLAITLGYFVI